MVSLLSLQEVDRTSAVAPRCPKSWLKWSVRSTIVPSSSCAWRNRSCYVIRGSPAVSTAWPGARSPPSSAPPRAAGRHNGSAWLSSSPAHGLDARRLAFVGRRIYHARGGSDDYLWRCTHRRMRQNMWYDTVTGATSHFPCAGREALSFQCNWNAQSPTSATPSYTDSI